MCDYYEAFRGVRAFCGSFYSGGLFLCVRFRAFKRLLRRFCVGLVGLSPLSFSGILGGFLSLKKRTAEAVPVFMS